MTASNFTLQCAGCTAPLDEVIVEKGVHRCPFCGFVNILPKTEQTSEVNHQLYNGDSELRDYDFERAYSAYARAAELDEKESKAYFGMALAKNKIKYIKDIVNNRWQAICCEVSDKKFSEDKNYLRALEYATEEQRAEYVARAEEIDYIREKFAELEKSGLSYDTFLCVKVSDENGGFTQDSVWAGKLYDSIKKAGMKPFYSEKEIGDRMGEDYEALILYALYTSKSMIIVCSNEDYLRTPWVQNEYTRYHSMLTADDKAKNSIMIAFAGDIIERIPSVPGKIQGADLHSFDASQKINEFVSKHANAEERARKKAEEKAKAEAERKAKEEAEAQEREAQRAEIEELKKALLETKAQMNAEKEESAKKKEAANIVPAIISKIPEVSKSLKDKITAKKQAIKDKKEKAKAEKERIKLEQEKAEKKKRRNKVIKIILIIVLSILLVAAVTSVILYKTLFDQDGLAKTATVTFDTSDYPDADCDEQSREITIGFKIGKLPTPTLDGYTFKGWYIHANENCTEEEFKADILGNGEKVKSTFVVNEDITLCAYFVKDLDSSSSEDYSSSEDSSSSEETIPVCSDGTQNHYWNTPQTTVPTCEANGTKSQSCSLCGYIVYDSVYESQNLALEHKWSKWIVAPMEKKRECEREGCGKTEQQKLKDITPYTTVTVTSDAGGWPSLPEWPSILTDGVWEGKPNAMPKSGSPLTITILFNTPSEIDQIAMAVQGFGEDGYSSKFEIYLWYANETGFREEMAASGAFLSTSGSKEGAICIDRSHDDRAVKGIKIVMPKPLHGAEYFYELAVAKIEE